MGIVASWEEFLEQSLVRYVAGARTQGGYRPTPKYGLAKDMSHAYELLAQDPDHDPLKHYLRMSDPSWVRGLADYFFHPHPYASLQPKTDLLLHATRIRNRVAHDSQKCREDFKQTTLHFLHFPHAKLPQSFVPGDLLVTSVSRHFSQATIQAGSSHFEAYAQLYESLAGAIVP